MARNTEDPSLVLQFTSLHGSTDEQKAILAGVTSRCVDLGCSGSMRLWKAASSNFVDTVSLGNTKTEQTRALSRFVRCDWAICDRKRNFTGPNKWPYSVLEELIVAQPGQEITGLSWNPEVHRSLQQVPNKSQINPITNSVNILLNIMFLPTYNPSCSRFFKFSDQNCICISHIFLVFYMPRPSHHPWFNHLNNILWSVQIIKIILKQFFQIFSSAPCFQTPSVKMLPWT
jgi:hypothetical protein